MVFANVPNDKYDSLSPEDKEAVDKFRNQEYDVDVQKREAGQYTDVIGRDENASVDSTPKPRPAKSAKNVNGS
jgi:hypothetical protein